jgi:hypothetical protein
MCKDKWNYLNSNYKKILNYHKGINHNMSFWELVVDGCDKYHLLKQFKKEYYNTIKTFQVKWNVSAPFHVIDLWANGDKNYIVIKPKVNT